jgi:hypothetical protein
MTRPFSLALIGLVLALATICVAATVWGDRAAAWQAEVVR